MTKIVLISCVSQKLHHKAKAKDLYIGDLFKYSLKYAESLNPDKIFVLSAKYGLLDLDDEIDYYNETLSYVPKKQREKKPDLKVLSNEERKEWAKKVIQTLREKCDLDSDEIIFLAGERYFRNLIPYITNYVIPLKGIVRGKRVPFLKEKLK